MCGRGLWGQAMTRPGTWNVSCTPPHTPRPGHDVNDYEIGKRHKLAIINIMDDDGRLNAAAGAFAGVDRFEARTQVWQGLEVRTRVGEQIGGPLWVGLCELQAARRTLPRVWKRPQLVPAHLTSAKTDRRNHLTCAQLHPARMFPPPYSRRQAAGLALRTEAHTSRVPRAQRGGEVVEPLVREQWFVKMEGLAGPALKVILCGEGERAFLEGPRSAALGCAIRHPAQAATMPNPTSPTGPGRGEAEHRAGAL